PASAAEPDLAATLASIRASADAARRRYEIIVAVNGPADPAPALVGAHAFARAAGVPLVEEERAPSPSVAPVMRVLRLFAHSKVDAWNAIRAAARAPIIVFTDADVRLAPDAIGLLVARLEAEPTLAAAAGREVAALAAGDGL